MAPRQELNNPETKDHFLIEYNQIKKGTQNCTNTKTDSNTSENTRDF